MWITCDNEALPPTHINGLPDTVLVTLLDPEDDSTWVDSAYWDGHWMFSHTDTRVVHYLVIAWQPFPAPYGEEIH